MINMVDRLESETEILKITPSLKPPLSILFSSFSFFALTIYFYYFTEVPYAVPTITYIIWFIIFYRGISLTLIYRRTIYYVTNKRVLREYRFVKLKSNEIPIPQIRAIEESRSILGNMFNLGDVNIFSGQSKSMIVKFANISNSTKVANEIRKLVGT